MAEEQPFHPPSSTRRRRRGPPTTSRSQRPNGAMLLAAACLALSDATPFGSRSLRDRFPSPAAARPSAEGAFVGPSPRGRRNRCSRRSTQQEQGERVAEGSRGVAGGNDGHPYYIGDTRRDGIRRQSLDLDEKIGGDEPRAAVHPIQNAYDRLSTTPTTEEEDRLEVFYLDFLEGSGKKLPENDEGSPPVDGGGDDDEELWANDEGTKSEQPTTTDDRKSIDDGDDGDEKRWAKRNARSIDEGVRFKSQLREGLEEQTKLHREKLLNNLLEGVIGGTTSALEIETAEIKNVTNRFGWLGFGRGNKQLESEGGEGKVTEEATDVIPVGRYQEIAIQPDMIAYETRVKQSRSNAFGARLITGLIMALAEEVEGLDVEVDADSDTPISEKAIRSVKIYFSRLGFRQLRMGGLDEAFSDPESSMSISERFAMARRFFDRPETADEAFDRIDADNSGGLDEGELEEALRTASLIGGNGGFRARSRGRLAELASRLVRLYDADGNGVVDRDEYQAMVEDMASLKEARQREATQRRAELRSVGSGEGGEKKRRWLSSVFRGRKGVSSGDNSTVAGEEEVVDVTDNKEFWGTIIDHGEGSIVLEDLKLDLRRLLFGVIPGVKRILPGGPLILEPFTATVTVSFTKEDVMESVLLDTGLRRLVARAISRRVRSIRDLLDGAVFYGRTWKLFEQNSPQVEVAKLEDVHFDKRDRLIITGRAKITETLGVRHEPIEQGFKVRTKIGTRANGRIIGLLQPEIAIFAECPKEFETIVRKKCKEWFDYTIPTFQPLYTYIPLVSPLKRNDKMDGFDMGEDNQIKSIEIKNGKLYLQLCAFLRPGRFLGNHYLAFTVPNRTLILTLDRVREGMRNARRNKRLAELAAREVQQLAAAQDESEGDDQRSPGTTKPFISPEAKLRIQRLEKEVKATIQEDAILREMEESKKVSGKGFIARFAEGYSGAIREELDLEMNARLSSSISDFFGSQDSEGEDKES